MCEDQTGHTWKPRACRSSGPRPPPTPHHSQAPPALRRGESVPLLPTPPTRPPLLAPAGTRCSVDCDAHASFYLEHILTVDEAESRESGLQVVQCLSRNRNKARVIFSLCPPHLPSWDPNLPPYLQACSPLARGPTSVSGQRSPVWLHSSPGSSRPPLPPNEGRSKPGRPAPKR